MKYFWGYFLIVFALTGCQTVSSPLPQGQNETTQDIQKAVTAVTGAVTGESFQVKYCPIDGEHFSAKVEKCPVHGIKLILIEE